MQARKDWRERALTHAGRVPSERVQRLELPAEPAPGAARRRSPRAAFPSPGPRPHSATLTRRLRRSATEGNGGRKAATHLDYAHPPHALALAHEMSPANCRTFPARRPMMFWQPCVGTFGNVAAETHTHASARTRRHHRAHSGRPRVIRLPVSLRPSSRSGTWREFRLDQPCLGIKVASASPAVGAVRNLLSEPRHAPGLCFYSMYIGAGGEKQESHWARQRASGSLTSCLMRVDWPAQPYLKPAQTI